MDANHLGSTHDERSANTQLSGVLDVARNMIVVASINRCRRSRK
jgi:hypothetical protein